MDTFKLPLSGDVSQFIAPWSWFVRQAGQVGLVNIDIGSTPAPDVEAKVLDEVGSYGRQIGRLSDAVEVLIGLIDRDSLNQAQRDAIAAFEAQVAEVRRIKVAGGRGEQPVLATGGVRARG
jgi:hypothetical protein